MDEISVFHEGEMAIQTRLGVERRVGAIAKHFVRDHMTDEHAEFFPQLPALLVGSRDPAGQSWASILCSQPGFISTAGPRQLDINASPTPGDPLAESLNEGGHLGLLGLQFETRRRNRVNGRVSAMTAQGFSLAIDQTFGNCPKYIQTRAPVFLDTVPGDPIVQSALGLNDIELVHKADTFFIATGIEGRDGDARVGNDISHRGGKPGFVKVEGNTLVWPDFVGNYMFNTLGNLAIDPRAGLLFIDFEQGDTLQLTGQAEVLWDHPLQEEFAAAERFVSFQVEKVMRIPGALPLRWEFMQASPFLIDTGIWTY